ncbi:Membrane bound protein complex subunit mbxA [Marinitoga hydrogenitolerans DSM 16785]|uniref:Membrane bound protein complex subunit mbxA n=1 Tax=Marinitoga hydrogenitolerans (strain DSM 16785 / JCM 12826 / AT1271) TaxID=1122195 RepID=A0A1M4W6Z7_MARH1|nr:Na+/H+ antiporter subunit E [Marinitoga hydrogenitolerans]SHE77041.1 Membrane bound protein complex subunit mbxA [Marinitoga hydrogenitolerans DSM 16785]
MKKYISTFLTLWAIWIALTGFSIQEILTGLLVSLVLSGIISKVVDYSFDFTLIPKVFMFVFVYIPVFIIEMIKANIDVAVRILTPSLPLNPGFVKVPTKLKGNVGKLTLANSITLTPGTLSIDADKDSIYIHWIDVKGETPEEYQKFVSGKFEKILGGIYK